MEALGFRQSQFAVWDPIRKDEKPESALDQLMESLMVSTGVGSSSTKKKSIKEAEEEFVEFGKFKRSTTALLEDQQFFGFDVVNHFLWPDEAAQKSLEIYYDQLTESEGFDIQDFPGLSEYTTIVPLTHIHVDTGLYNLVAGFAKLAITNYNKENGKAFEFIDLVKVNRGIAGGFRYYITFIATDGSSGVLEFQAIIWSACGRDPKVSLCRLKRK